MIGTKADPAISPAIVKAHPDQAIPRRWRWGPRWTLGERSGVWVVDKILHVAVRVEDDPTAELLDVDDFGDELDDARDAGEDAIGDGHLEVWMQAARRAEVHRQRGQEQAARFRLRKAVREGRLGGPDDGAAAAVPA